MEVSQEHVVFSDKVWGQVYEDSKKYFPEQEIVGWFVSIPGFNMQMNEMLLKTHLNHFAGNDKTLFVVGPGEWEEAFFLYENNQLIRQPGYYIYYEKNDLMQSYMIEMSQNKSIEETEKIPDRAVADFRKAVKEKKEGERETPGQGKKVNLGWAAGTCAAAAVLAIGITFFNSYQNIQGTLDNWIPGVYAQEESEIASVENVQVTLTPTAPAAKEEKTETEMETIRTEDVQQKTENLPADDDLADEVKEEADIPIADEEDSELPVQNTDISGSEYVIKRGDTMTSICKEKYGTIDRIEEVCRANGITPEDIIYAGQKIILPD